ncbi:MAG: HAD hydrolase family protein [Clostridiales bacterium]|nr:HAD hydrolase family protein [Clostridiales bacterium]
MKTLYVSDLDGTLLNSAGKLSDYSVNTINTLLDEGILFTVATARSITIALSAVGNLNLTLPIIVYNGGFIIDPKDGRIIRSPLPLIYGIAVSKTPQT